MNRLRDPVERQLDLRMHCPTRRVPAIMTRLTVAAIRTIQGSSQSPTGPVGPAIDNPTSWSPADLDYDGDTDQDDTTNLVQYLLNTNYGDANLDGSVDLADFNAWLTGSPGDGWAGGDFNGEGSIDLADFNIWLTTLPPTAPLMDAVPVPEPTPMALFGLVGLLAAGRRHCRRASGPLRALQPRV